MNNIIISEETLHYAARFLERWAEKTPTQCHNRAEKELRKISNHLIENLYTPAFVSVIRAQKKA